MPETSIDVLFARNVHGVPKDTLIKMKDRLQAYPGEVIYKDGI